MDMNAVLSWSLGKSHNFDAGIRIVWAKGPMNFGELVIYNHEGALHADTEGGPRSSALKVLRAVAERLAGPAPAAVPELVKSVKLADCWGEFRRDKPPFPCLKGGFTLKLELHDGGEVDIRFEKHSEQQPFAMVSDTAPEMVHAAFERLGLDVNIPQRPHFVKPVEPD